MPFKSRAQQGKFFADPRLRPFARRWAHESGMGGGRAKAASKRAYARLPQRAKTRASSRRKR